MQAVSIAGYLKRSRSFLDDSGVRCGALSLLEGCSASPEMVWVWLRYE